MRDTAALAGQDQPWQGLKKGIAWSPGSRQAAAECGSKSVIARGDKVSVNRYQSKAGNYVVIDPWQQGGTPLASVTRVLKQWDRWG